ncbi:hypothetical protein V8G54_037844 [Vigna mungo]|uniref:Homologous recombination OB-fold protein OB-fold domain-containing protein n=1 Tax=Vigna mungo TaxID=3915 RepID=A0AAQ3MK17_VIGMU
MGSSADVRPSNKLFVRHSMKTNFVGGLNAILSEEQKCIILKTPFSWFLELQETLKIGRNILSDLLIRWVDERGGFLFGEKLVEFNEVDVTLSLGLSLVGDKINLNDNNLLESQCQDYFDKRKGKYELDMIYEFALKNHKKLPCLDVCKLYILVGISDVLLPSRRRTVIPIMFEIVDRISDLSCYCWGRIVYDYLLSSFCKAVVAWNGGKGASNVYVDGCVYVFKVLFCDHFIPSNSCAHKYPRILHWMTISVGDNFIKGAMETGVVVENYGTSRREIGESSVKASGDEREYAAALDEVLEEQDAVIEELEQELFSLKAELLGERNDDEVGYSTPVTTHDIGNDFPGQSQCQYRVAVVIGERGSLNAEMGVIAYERVLYRKSIAAPLSWKWCSPDLINACNGSGWEQRVCAYPRGVIAYEMVCTESPSLLPCPGSGAPRCVLGSNLGVIAYERVLYRKSIAAPLSWKWCSPGLWCACVSAYPQGVIAYERVCTESPSLLPCLGSGAPHAYSLGVIAYERVCTESPSLLPCPGSGAPRCVLGSDLGVIAYERVCTESPSLLPCPGSGVPRCVLGSDLKRIDLELEWVVFLHVFHSCVSFLATMMNRISDDPRTTKQFAEEVAQATYERDFNSNPWKWAEMYIKHHDIVEDGDIKNVTHLQTGKSWSTLHLVVCIVKECFPNELGDMLLTLKDPYGTMKASLHNKVLKDPNFGPHIGLGSVRTFSAFPPNYYVNIVVRNVIKVFAADICPPTKELVMETPKPVIRPLVVEDPNIAEILRKLRNPHHLQPSSSNVADNNIGDNSNAITPGRTRKQRWTFGTQPIVSDYALAVSAYTGTSDTTTLFLINSHSWSTFGRTREQRWTFGTQPIVSDYALAVSAYTGTTDTTTLFLINNHFSHDSTVLFQPRSTSGRTREQRWTFGTQPTVSDYALAVSAYTGTSDQTTLFLINSHFSHDSTVLVQPSHCEPHTREHFWQNKGATLDFRYTAYRKQLRPGCKCLHSDLRPNHPLPHPRCWMKLSHIPKRQVVVVNKQPLMLVSA